MLKEGSEKARKKAASKMEEVKNAMRINYFDDLNLINDKVKKYSDKNSSEL